MTGATTIMMDDFSLPKTVVQVREREGSGGEGRGGRGEERRGEERGGDGVC